MADLTPISVKNHRQSLIAHGYHPLEALNRAKQPFGAAWNTKPPCVDVHPERLSTALLAKGIWVIDVDTEDKASADSILNFCDETFGSSVKRLRTDTARFALIFQGFGKPAVGKISLGSKGMIDILGVGRCIMVDGEHRDQAGSFYYLERLVPRVELPLLDNKSLTLLEERFASVSIQNKSGEQRLMSGGQVTEGGRNDYLFREACRLQHAGVPEEIRRAHLRILNESVIQNPLDDDELMAISQSSGRYPPSVNRSSKLMPASKPYPATDVGVMERFRHLLGAERKIVPAWGEQWLAWHGFIWVPVRSIQNDVIDVIRSMHLEVGLYPDRSEELKKYLKTSENGSKIAAITKLIKQDEELIVDAENLDAIDGLVGCQTTVIDLHSGNDAPINAEYWITKQCNADFDQDASCPRWVDFVNEIFAENQELIAYVQKALGMALGFGNKEQILIVLYGAGANGKSVFLKVIQEIFGDYVRQVSPETLTESKRSGGGPREDLLRLKGCRLMLTSETDENETLAAGLVKAMVGGDKCTARGLWADKSVEFVINAMPILATNHLPRIRDTSDGMWRRLKPIRMGVTIPVEKRDPNLVEKLLEERSGILNWIGDGTRQYLREGLSDPEDVIIETSAYRSESDVLLAWINDACQFDSSQSSDLGALYLAYQVAISNDGAKPCSKKRFGAVLRERFQLISRKSNGKTVIEGIVLNHVIDSAVIAPIAPNRLVG